MGNLLHRRKAFQVGGGPAYVGLAGVYEATGSVTGTDDVVTLDVAIPVGSMSVVLTSTDYDITSITDSGGNTYTEQAELLNSIKDMRIWSAPVITALAVSDTVTLNYDTVWYSGRQLEVHEVANASVVDVVATYNVYGATHAPSGTTTAVTTIVGFLAANSSVTVDTAVNCTLLTRRVQQSRMSRGFYLDSSVVGSQSVGVTTAGNQSMLLAWVAFR